MWTGVCVGEDKGCAHEMHGGGYSAPACDVPHLRTARRLGVPINHVAVVAVFSAVIPPVCI